MKVKFKEKTYETYFQSEVSRLTTISFAPDQVDESLLGFDGAFFVPFIGMPGLIPYVRAARWRRFVGLPASAIDRFGQELNDRLPQFNLNLFVQYKRPERMTRSSSSEWQSWNAPYYRYATEYHQQKLLEKITAASNGRAAVVYASPAFWTNAELFAHAEAGTIVTNSNIADIALLTGHHRFSYCSAGHFGMGHSEPESIESLPFETIIRRGVNNETLPFTQQLKDLEQIIKTVLKGDRGSERLWQSARNAIRDGRSIDGSLPEGGWLGAIYSIVAFAHAFDVRVTALGLGSKIKRAENPQLT
ncbi:MAG: hypothetical protein JSS55_15790 [Proteobacteria bacterium]|nr:hypothetical protein [Pseudomonadota bacterium]